MKHARRAGKRDANEHAVIHIARGHGWLVMQLDNFDLLCFRRGVFKVVEVKSGNAPLTAHQEKLIEDGWPLEVCRSVEDAEKIFA